MATDKPLRDVLPADLRRPAGQILGAYDADAVTRAYIAEAKRRDAIARWQHECPTDYRDFDRAHPQLAPYRTPIENILSWEPGPRGLLAAGETGRGKTRTMWSLVRRLAFSGTEVRTYHATEWFSELQRQVNYGRDDAHGWIKAVAHRPIVFIDDLGQEAIARNREDWAAGWFMRFLDIRLSERRPLLVTTNLTAQEIVGHQDQIRADPMLRRLLEICEVVRF